MESFSISEMYTLELRWRDVSYEQDNVCKFRDAYFAGPALSNAQEIGGDNHIMMDFNKQYPIFIKNAYIAKFSWGEVVYNGDGTVTLKDAVMEHDKLNKVPKLKASDYIVIDTENHEEAVHILHLNYTSYVINENHTMYNFMKGR
jgi:hypothetical protein